MTKYEMEHDGYQYTVNPLETAFEGLQVGNMECYVHFARAFAKAQEEWEKRIKNEEELKYYDAWYLDSMVLALDGIPCALIKDVDDTVQVFEIKQEKKVQ